MRAARKWSARPARLAFTVLTLSVLGYLTVRLACHPSSFDLAVYRAEGRAVLRGIDIYGPIGAPGGSLSTYPPFAALGFVPLSIMPFGLAIMLALLVNLSLLFIACVLSYRFTAIDRRLMLPAAALAAAVLLWSEPVFTTLRYGQIDLVLLVLVLWDFTAAPDSRRRGIGIGLAAALKVTPAIFIIYLVLTGRRRAALTAVGTLATTVTLSGLALPHATWGYWTRYLFDTARVGRPENAENQSLHGVLVRLDQALHLTRGENVLIMIAAVTGLALATCAHRLLGDEWGLPACAVTGLLCSPVSWTHHWVWIVPLGILLARRARPWLPLLIPFFTYTEWTIPHERAIELHLSWLDQLVAAQYVFAGVVFLGCVARRCQQRVEFTTVDQPDSAGAAGDHSLSARTRVAVSSARSGGS